MRSISKDDEVATYILGSNGTNIYRPVTLASLEFGVPVTGTEFRVRGF